MLAKTNMQEVTYVRDGVIIPALTVATSMFGINCPSAFVQILKFSKITRVIYPKNVPNQTCGYWLITSNQQILLLKLTFSQLAVANQQAGNYKTVGNYKVTPLTLLC